MFFSGADTGFPTEFQNIHIWQVTEWAVFLVYDRKGLNGFKSVLLAKVSCGHNLH